MQNSNRYKMTVLQPPPQIALIQRGANDASPSPLKILIANLELEFEPTHRELSPLKILNGKYFAIFMRLTRESKKPAGCPSWPRQAGAMAETPQDEAGDKDGVVAATASSRVTRCESGVTALRGLVTLSSLVFARCLRCETSRRYTPSAFDPDPSQLPGGWNEVSESSVGTGISAHRDGAWLRNTGDGSSD